MAISDDLELALSVLNKDLKEPIATQANEENWSDIPSWTSTGSTLLDTVMTSKNKDGEIIGCGWAGGRWYEIFGEESTGKSTLVEHAFAENQKKDGISALIDSEAGFSKPRAEMVGVDLSRLVMFEAPYIEKGVECFSKLMNILKSKPSLKSCPVMAAWDTLISCSTKNEYEYALQPVKDVEDDDEDEDSPKKKKWSGGMAEKPRVIRQMYRDLTSKLPGFNACFIVVNQVSSTMATRKYEKKTDTTGGWGPKFHSSARMELQRIGTFTDPFEKNMVGGIIVRVKFVKSKLFIPYATVDIPINFETGIDDDLSIVNFLVQNTNFVTNRGGRYYCPEYLGDSTTGKRLPEFLELVKSDELFRDTLVIQVRENAKQFWKKAATYATPKEERE